LACDPLLCRVPISRDGTRTGCSTLTNSAAPPLVSPPPPPVLYTKPAAIQSNNADHPF
jgi:hypothetical protein